MRNTFLHSSLANRLPFLAITGKLREHEAGVIVSGAIQDTIIVPFGEVKQS